MRINEYNQFNKEQIDFASKWFKDKSLKVSETKPYILSERKDWKFNIINASVIEYIEKCKKESKSKKMAFPLHLWLHHGLSSQAMLFNLFGEAVANNDVEIIYEALGFVDIPMDNAKVSFELSDREVFKEMQHQPTSFDLAILNDNGGNVFLEAKYTETEFSGCSVVRNGNCDGLNPIGNIESCYLTSKGCLYWELMRKYKLDEPYKNTPICPFVIYYQFYREILFALEKEGCYVLLTDKRNPAFKNSNPQRGLIPILRDRLPKDKTGSFKTLYIQDVVRILHKHKKYDMSEFGVKYGIKM